MDSATALSIEFLRSHPKRAATVLEGIGPEDAAAFLKAIPDDVAGQTLDTMQPLTAAAIVPALTKKKAVAALLAMDVHGRLRVMRLLEEGSMKSIMDQMPKGAARDLARLLRYPNGSAGAWMASDVAVFDKSTLVHDCLTQFRAMPERVRNVVFVTDAKKLYGSVDLARLLAAPDDEAIESVANTAIKRVSPYARLTSLVALSAWDTALSLPVVDTKGEFLGALHFDRLREGLASELHAGGEQHIGRVAFHLAEAFLVCATGLLEGPPNKAALSRPAGKPET